VGACPGLRSDGGGVHPVKGQAFEGAPGLLLLCLGCSWMMEAVEDLSCSHAGAAGSRQGFSCVEGCSLQRLQAVTLVTGHLRGTRVIAAMELGPGHGFYVDQGVGDHGVGQEGWWGALSGFHLEDAACYLCW
jgi:hypothetical protein